MAIPVVTDNGGIVETRFPRIVTTDRQDNSDLANAVIPDGTIEIDKNGNYGVANYEYATVNVAGPKLFSVDIVNNYTGKGFVAEYLNSEGKPESKEFGNETLTVYVPENSGYYKARTPLVGLYCSAGGLTLLETDTRGIWCVSNDGKYAVIFPKNISSSGVTITISNIPE